MASLPNPFFPGSTLSPKSKPASPPTSTTAPSPNKTSPNGNKAASATGSSNTTPPNSSNSWILLAADMSPAPRAPSRGRLKLCRAKEPRLPTTPTTRLIRSRITSHASLTRNTQLATRTTSLMALMALITSSSSGPNPNTPPWPTTSTLKPTPTANGLPSDNSPTTSLASAVPLSPMTTFKSNATGSPSPYPTPQKRKNWNSANGSNVPTSPTLLKTKNAASPANSCEKLRKRISTLSAQITLLSTNTSLRFAWPKNSWLAAKPKKPKAIANPVPLPQNRLKSNCARRPSKNSSPPSPTNPSPNSTPNSTTIPTALNPSPKNQPEVTPTFLSALTAPLLQRLRITPLNVAPVALRPAFQNPLTIKQRPTQSRAIPLSPRERDRVRGKKPSSNPPLTTRIPT